MIMINLEVCCQILRSLIREFNFCGNEWTFIDIPVHVTKFQQFFNAQTIMRMQRERDSSFAFIRSGSIHKPPNPGISQLVLNWLKIFFISERFPFVLDK